MTTKPVDDEAGMATRAAAIIPSYTPVIHSCASGNPVRSPSHHSCGSGNPAGQGVASSDTLSDWMPGQARHDDEGRCRHDDEGRCRHGDEARCRHGDGVDPHIMNPAGILHTPRRASGATSRCAPLPVCACGSLPWPATA